MHIFHLHIFHRLPVDHILVFGNINAMNGIIHWKLKFRIRGYSTNDVLFSNNPLYNITISITIIAVLNVKTMIFQILLCFLAISKGKRLQI